MCLTVAVSGGGGFGEVVQDGSSGDPKCLGAWLAMGDVAVALFVSLSSWVFPQRVLLAEWRTHRPCCLFTVEFKKLRCPSGMN